MKTFTKALRRLVTIKSPDRALPAREWILTLDDSGVSFRRMGERGRSWRLSWKTVIGLGLVHDVRTDGAPKAKA